LSAEKLIAACAFGIIALVPMLLTVNIVFYIRLKRHERSTWEVLGSPMPFLNLDMSNFATVRAYLKKGFHRELSDSVSRTLGSLVLAFDRIFLGFAAVAVAVVGYIVAFIDP
jgi:hypothetical protein